MPRYIDADALVNKLDSLAKKYSDLGKAEVVKDYIWASAVVEAAPTADVVEVVRCKDCRHMTEELGYRYCNVWQGINGGGDDGFCNYGERKTDESKKEARCD